MRTFEVAEKARICHTLAQMSSAFSPIIQYCEELERAGALAPEYKRLFQAFSLEVQAELNETAVTVPLTSAPTAILSHFDQLVATRHSSVDGRKNLLNMSFNDRPVRLPQSKDGDFASTKILLMDQAPICSDQQFVASQFGRLQQGAVFESRPAQFICGSNAMTGQGPA